jgi:hypothetical protein
MAQGFLQAPNGNYSSARLMFIIGLSYDMVLTAMGLFLLHWTPGEAIAFFSAVASVFVALKLGQNAQETKPTTDEVKS